MSTWTDEEIHELVSLWPTHSAKRRSPGTQSPLLVPDTLHDSLMARLDQLAPVKTVAQIAAVIGRDFSFELLKATAPFSETDVQAAIDRLLASGLVFRSGHVSGQSFSSSMLFFGTRPTRAYFMINAEGCMDESPIFYADISRKLLIQIPRSSRSIMRKLAKRN